MAEWKAKERKPREKEEKRMAKRVSEIRAKEVLWEIGYNLYQFSQTLKPNVSTTASSSMKSPIYFPSFYFILFYFILFTLIPIYLFLEKTLENRIQMIWLLLNHIEITTGTRLSIFSKDRSRQFC